MRFNYQLSLFVVSVIVVLAACKGPQTTTSSTKPQGGKYTEDLSVWRPKTEAVTPTETSTTVDDRKATDYVEPKLTVNKPLDTVLDSMSQFNLKRNFIEGFTIQVYSGKKEEALNAKKVLATSLPKLSSEVQFTEPIFRVKVGRYYSRLDAQQDYVQVKRYFPAAILIPERIAIR